MAKKRPKTPEELAALARQIAAKDLDRRFRNPDSLGMSSTHGSSPSVSNERPNASNGYRTWVWPLRYSATALQIRETFVHTAAGMSLTRVS